MYGDWGQAISGANHSEGLTSVGHDIANPMDFVFDAPMLLHEVQEILRQGFFRQTTPDTIGVLVSERQASQVGRRATRC